ncbi:MAG TPA: hypothetical protein VMX16_04435 [Terriglobia bacterium]|nr:hypothetical protein [Terriglobia bacterium]
MNKLQQTLLPIKQEQTERRLTSLAGLIVVEELRAEREELTLDVDATIIAAEKQEAEWAYAKVKGYQSLLG